MTVNEASNNAIIQALPYLMPPQAVIHIGAGTGNGDMHLWRQWQVPHALIVDADETRLDWAYKLAEQNPEWLVRNAVLAENEAEADYYHASNPAEDGLISPDSLKELWPNLRTNNQAKCQTLRLDNLLQDQVFNPIRQSKTVWTVIDCLSAKSILMGAGSELDRWSVLWLRVLLKPLNDEQSLATLNDLEAFLQPHGYRCIQVTEANHPAIGQALFVRDWQAVLVPQIDKLNVENAEIAAKKEVLNQHLSEQTGRVDELQRQVYAAMQERDEQASLAEQCHVQIQQLTAELKRNNQVLAECQDHVEQLEQVRDAQTALVELLQAQSQQLTAERDVHASQANECLSQIEVLSQANTLLDQEKLALIEHREVLSNEVATLTQARDEQAYLAAERLSRIEALTQECYSNAKRVAEKQAQFETLTQANATLDQEKSAIVESRDVLASEVAALTQTRDEQAQLATERLLNIEALTQANTLLSQEKSVQITRGDALANEVAALNLARDEQAQLATERQSCIDVLTQERDVYAAQANDRLSQIEALTQANASLSQEKSVQITRGDALANEVAILTQARDEQAQLATERLSMIEVLTQERDVYAAQANDRRNQIEALIQSNSKLDQEKLTAVEQREALANEMAALRLVRDEQTQIATQRNHEIEQLQVQLRQNQERILALEAEITERDARQYMLNEEMIKAEAQIDLIKDVLLREPGL